VATFGDFARERMELGGVIRVKDGLGRIEGEED